MKENNYQEVNERARIGKLSGAVGILCNVILSVSKMMMGTLSGSMSILADGLNNLSDGASSIVTLAAFKLAEKPADKEHPYGHARFEYLASLTVSMMILVIGFELAKSSVGKILHPTAIEFSGVMVGVLIFSIGVKAFMMFFNRSLGEKISSSVLLAAAADSRNDVITTGAVLLAAVAEQFTGWKIDGVMGLLVSVFILYSGIILAKETVSPLLGEGADPELKKRLTEYIEACPMVIGCHDLMVHDYGPGRRYASIHVEMDREMDVLQCHENIDKMERECLKEFGTHMVIHYDPVLINDPETERIKRLVITILQIKDERLEIHDFRMTKKRDSVELTFDMIVPEDLRGKEERIKSSLEQALNRLEETRYTTNIIFDI